MSAVTVWAPVPSKVTVPLLCVQVPELDQLPLTVIEAELSGLKIPAAAAMVTSLKLEVVAG